MGRISAYTGKIVRWSDLMQNPNSEFCDLRIGPDPMDFERGTVRVPIEEAVPVPGDRAPITSRGGPRRDA